jgi:hypothetical protein
MRRTLLDEPYRSAALRWKPAFSSGTDVWMPKEKVMD